MAKKICVVMWFDDNIKSYAEINYIINKKYCDKYGYDIVKSSEKRTDLEATWERVPLIIEQLNDYDYVIWIDADAIFLKNSPPITNVIEAHSEKLFILSGDLNTQKECDINAGFIIVKQSPISFKTLNQWYKNPAIRRIGHNLDTYHILDQGALRYMYDKNLFQLKANSVIIKYGILQSFPSFQEERLTNINEYGLTNRAFVAHLASNSHKHRDFFSKNVLKYQFPNTCKCGFKKHTGQPSCCLMCNKNNGHGPLCAGQ